MKSNEELKWIWAYSEQLHLFDTHDAFWINCASLGWKGSDREDEFNIFLTLYGLKRGKIGNYLKYDINRKELIEICNREFSKNLTKNYYIDAQDRWNNVVETMEQKIGAYPDSAILKILWFYPI